MTDRLLLRSKSKATHVTEQFFFKVHVSSRLIQPPAQFLENSRKYVSDPQQKIRLKYFSLLWKSADFRQNRRVRVRYVPLLEKRILQQPLYLNTTARSRTSCVTHRGVRESENVGPGREFFSGSGRVPESFGIPENVGIRIIRTDFALLS